MGLNLSHQSNYEEETLKKKWSPTNPANFHTAYFLDAQKDVIENVGLKSLPFKPSSLCCHQRETDAELRYCTRHQVLLETQSLAPWKSSTQSCWRKADRKCCKCCRIHETHDQSGPVCSCLTFATLRFFAGPKAATRPSPPLASGWRAAATPAPAPAAGPGRRPLRPRSDPVHTTHTNRRLSMGVYRL